MRSETCGRYPDALTRGEGAPGRETEDPKMQKHLRKNGTCAVKARGGVACQPAEEAKARQSGGAPSWPAICGG